MFITHKSLPRRTVLRGLGATVALPFLESMVPAMTALAQTPARPPLRFGAVYVPNGCPIPYWMPPGEAGALPKLPPILEPLEPFRDRLTVIGQLARAGGASVTDHAVSSAGWLTGAVAKQTEAEDIKVGISIDQVLAKHIGQETPFPSLEYATEDFTGYIGGCVPGYSCTYMNTISWAGEAAPLPMEINPRVAFERLFGRAGSAEDRLRRLREDFSILDSVVEEAGALKAAVGAADRRRLDEYLENVREIERRIARAEARNSAELSIAAPVGIPESFEEHMGLMFDLLALAYQADLTRVFTFMTGREASQRTYPGLGMSQTHHDTSHHGQQPDKMAQHARINAYFTQLFASFLERLRAAPEGEGTVLDHALIAYGTGMSDGQAHNSYPLPFALVGGACGKLRGNRYLIAPEWTSIANVWVGVANLFGVPLESFGESTGRFEV
jgi:hypothetical protein